MRRTLLLAVATIALVTTTGCWLEADDAAGSDEDRSELRDYAAAMRVWWLEVYGDEAPDVVFSFNIDYDRVLADPTAGYYGDDPLPSVEPPLSMEALHYLLVTTVFSSVRAEGEADLRGYYAGVAARFCDPRDAEEGESVYLLRHVAPLQIWRWYGDPCDVRWAGNRRAEGVPADPWRDFQWGCGNYDQLRGFQVSPYELEDACRDADDWGHAFDLTTRAWSAELVRLCGGELEVWRIPDPADALAACE